MRAESQICVRACVSTKKYPLDKTVNSKLHIINNYVCVVNKHLDDHF